MMNRKLKLPPINKDGREVRIIGVDMASGKDETVEGLFKLIDPEEGIFEYIGEKTLHSVQLNSTTGLDPSKQVTIDCGSFILNNGDSTKHNLTTVKDIPLNPRQAIEQSISYE